MKIRNMNRTQSQIALTFLELLDKEDLQKISVKMVCEESDISRGTFYSYFTDKYELLEIIKKEIQSELFDSITSSTQENIPIPKMYRLEKNSSSELARLIYSLTFNFVSCVYKYKGVLRIFLEYMDEYSYIKSLEHLYKKIFRQEIEKRYGFGFSYEEEFITSGVIMVLREWLINGARETPEQIHQAIINCVSCFPISIFIASDYPNYPSSYQ